MAGPESDILTALAEQQAELAALLDELAEPDWQRPSRCEGWTVTDVVLHLAQTNEMAIASATGEFIARLDELARDTAAAGSVEDGAGLLVDAERGEPTAAVQERWQRSVDELADALAACDPHRRVTWVAGELSARTLATTRLTETWIHTGDIAFAFDRTAAATDRLRHIARLAWRTLPYAFAGAGRELAGPVRFELRGPSGEQWEFIPDEPAATIIHGDALDLCLVAARRAEPDDTELWGDGPDVAAVLELVRTFA